MAYHIIHDGHTNEATPTSSNGHPRPDHVNGACRRCNGLMVVDHCFDALGDAGEIDCRVLRCIQCGDILDPVILRNRTTPPALTPKKHVKWSSAKLAAMGFR